MRKRTTDRIDRFYNRKKYNLYDYLISGQTQESYFVTKEMFYASLEEVENVKHREELAEKSIEANRFIMYAINQSCKENIIDMDDVNCGILVRFLSRNDSMGVSMAINMVQLFFDALVEQKVLNKIDEDSLYEVL